MVDLNQISSSSARGKRKRSGFVLHLGLLGSFILIIGEELELLWCSCVFSRWLIMDIWNCDGGLDARASSS